MNELRNFLWACSGAHKSLLERCPTDTNKYVGIGGTILFTAILAGFSGAYALYTVFDSIWIALLFGLIWALMIFNLDRFIVSSMKKKGSFFSDFFVALPRIVVALLIAFVIAKPLELKIFEKEIEAELIVMEQEVIDEQEQKIAERFQPEVALINDQIDEWNMQISEKESVRDELSAIARQEADGTGGSKQANLGPIYKTKKADLDRAQKELNLLNASILPLMDKANIDLSAIQDKIDAELARIERSPYNGFAARIAALGRISKKSEPINMAHIFIVLLFISIETAPIFVKLISPIGPYDYKLMTHEHFHQKHNEEQTEIKTVMAANKIKYDTHTGTYRNNAMIDSEKEIIDYDVRQKVTVGKAKSDVWRDKELSRIGVL